jgi:hypothetical protein
LRTGAGILAAIHGMGPGLRVMADGVVIAQSGALGRLSATLPP